MPAPASVARPVSARSPSSVLAPAPPSSYAVAVPTIPPPTTTTSNELTIPPLACVFAILPPRPNRRPAARPAVGTTGQSRTLVKVRVAASRIERRGVMFEDPSEPTDSVVDAVVRASRALVGITLRALSSVSDEVTLPQLRTLVVVSLQGPQTVSVLAERLDVHASTMTRMCNRLVARGLVARKPSAIDRREVVIEL